MANLIAVCGLEERLVRVRARPASVDELACFHERAYVERVRAASDDVRGGVAGDYAPVGAGSFEIALLAAGGVIAAVDAVLDGRVDNAYVLCRPPGHHAERDRGRGFCIFNNVVVGAHHAMRRLGAGARLAIVDYDVHHGNGTEHAFYESDDVLFISLHQDSLFPLDSGAVADVGAGRGVGYNLNVPLPPGSGLGAYAAAFERVVEPALRAFDADLLLVSSGFDASALDPLSHTMLNSTAFGDMARRLLRVARASAATRGRVVFAHEGGYSDVHAPFCGLRVVEALAGVDASNVVDPYDEEIALYAYQALQPHQNAGSRRITPSAATPATHKPARSRRSFASQRRRARAVIEKAEANVQLLRERLAAKRAAAQ